MNLFDNTALHWKRFVGNDRFDYPIDYSAALLRASDDGHVDLLYQWAPNSYCHFHRHTAHQTTSTVLAGELHVIDIDPDTGKETGRKIRYPGDYASKELGDVHMEHGGPEGALVLFNLYTTDGNLAESLTSDCDVIDTSTLEQILRGKSSR